MRSEVPHSIAGVTKLGGKRVASKGAFKVCMVSLEKTSSYKNHVGYIVQYLDSSTGDRSKSLDVLEDTSLTELVRSNNS
jgi:hypothetical protein